jgi:hypothetical protein
VFDIFHLARKEKISTSADVVSLVLSCLNQLANEKPQFLHVTLNTMEENANEFVDYVVVE